MKTRFIKKTNRKMLNPIQLKDMNSFYLMLLKMKKKRPKMNVNQLMKLTYPEPIYKLFKIQLCIS
jgi:hypothetical protein